MSKSARSVKDCLTVPGMSLPLSHLAPAAVYRESAQAAIPCQRTALNPADPWPFTKIAPQSDADWRKTAPEAEF